MQVRVRPLNKGEVFCCSLSAAKKVFKDTGITLNFAYYGRNYSAFDNTFYSSYLASNIKGYIIAFMSMESNYDHPILSFYALRETMFSPLMRREFEAKYLPEFLHLYNKQMSDKTLKTITEFIIVELWDGKMVFHRQIVK